jgi:hypothetical protein
LATALSVGAVLVMVQMNVASGVTALAWTTDVKLPSMVGVPTIAPEKTTPGKQVGVTPSSATDTPGGIGLAGRA